MSCKHFLLSQLICVSSEDASLYIQKLHVTLQLSNLSVHVNQLNVKGRTYADTKMEQKMPLCLKVMYAILVKVN